MVYQWKLPGLYSIPAQAAGEELDRIYQAHGKLDPADVVEESQREDAPLHGCFEWNDQAAAELYRVGQARGIIRAVVTVDDKRPQLDGVRAFVHVENVYQPMAVVVRSEDKMRLLMQNALGELDAFRKKYAALSELQSVFTAIDTLQPTLPHALKELAI